MALAKTAPKANRDVVQLISPERVEKVTMGIGAGAMRHLLDRLTDLYKDPIAATVREVISNAIDATVLLPKGERQPVRISTPTSLRSAFVVTDKGVGMSPDTVREIYTQYGASTKELDFDQIGAFGLGAKAPLAYCTEFNVVTTRDGVTTTFVVARKPEGNVTDILEVRENSSLPNGTTVTIPVRMSDVAQFNQHTETYRKFSFDVPVLVDGKEPMAQEYTLLKDDFLLHHDEETGKDTVGRVWIKRSRIATLLTDRFTGYSNLSFSYVLSGWRYSSASNGNYGYYGRQDDPALVVELKPGVVDFSSSRDEITRNDRSVAVDQRVSELINDKSSEGVDRIFELYHGFDKPAATDFAHHLVAAAQFKGKTLVIGRYSDTLELKPERFETSEGFNPIALASADYKGTLASAYIVTTEARSMPVMGEELFKDDFQFTLKTEPFRGTTVNEANKLTLDRIESKKFPHSVAKVLLVDAMVAQRTQRGYGRQNYTKVVVIPSPTADEMKRVQTFRKLFSENGYGNVAFLVAKKGKELDAQLKLVRENTQLEVEVKTAAELLEEGKALRAAARKTNPKTGEEPMELRSLTLDGFSTEKDATSSFARHSMKHATVTPDELMTSGALLVLTENNPSSALIGAANAGLAITDRPIYILSHRTAVKAKHYKELEDYEGVIAAQDFRTTSQVSEKIAASRTYAGRLLKSELKAAEAADIVSSVLRYLYWENKFLKAFNQFLKANHSEAKALVKILDLYEKGGNSRYYDLSVDEIRLALSPAQADALLSLKSTARAIGDSSSFTDEMLERATRCDRGFDEPLAQLLFEELYNRLTVSAAAKKAA